MHTLLLFDDKNEDGDKIKQDHVGGKKNKNSFELSFHGEDKSHTLKSLSIEQGM